MIGLDCEERPLSRYSLSGANIQSRVVAEELQPDV